MSLERPSTDDGIAVLNVPGQSPQTISVPARTLGGMPKRGAGPTLPG